ncbi:hypothetical protein D3P09_02760 [Paenibacillus pinisoli]|uniref:Uncharacterized protein n=1 Tax=Paenibacillus pinisoli TaxID=1276110 RepID=A0A3A6PMK1_9BACL|nr:hypothetical protein D3P09_02760 [Paenibacillus pinisoli]
MILKRYADWKGSLKDFLQIGDEVDEDIVNHFLNVLPPVSWSSTLLQMGEPYSHVGGRPTFATLKRDGGRWFYAGCCYCGERTPVING